MKKIFIFTFILFVSLLLIILGKHMFLEPDTVNSSVKDGTVQSAAIVNDNSDKKDVTENIQTMDEANQLTESNINNNVQVATNNNADSTTDTTKESSTTNAQLADFDPSKDYQYTSEALTKAMDGLQNLNELDKDHVGLSEESVQEVWQSVDAAVAENTISPVEGIKHKQWLSSLVDSAQLKQQLEADIAKVTEQLEADAKADREAQANDPKFIQYKAEEERLTQEILAKYPNDSVKAAAELDEALNKVRTQIYQ